MSLEEKIEQLTAEIRTLIAVLKSCTTGVSLNADTTAPTATAEKPAKKTEKSATAEEKTPVTVPTAGTEKNAPVVKAEQAEAPAMDAATFMTELHGLIKGVKGHADAVAILRKVLDTLGEESFRTLAASRYQEALQLVKAELEALA